VLRTKPETFIFGQVGYFVLNSPSRRFPASSTATPCFLSSSALSRKSLMNCFSSATIDPSPGALWSGSTCSASRAATLSRTASQLEGVPPSRKIPGTILFCTTSPETKVRSGSTNVSSSPLVCAPPNQRSRAVTPPNSSCASCSNVMSGVRGVASTSSSLNCAERPANSSIISLPCNSISRAGRHCGSGSCHWETRLPHQRVRDGNVMCQEEFLIAGRKFGRDPSDGGAIPRSQARIDDERRSVADNDSDVGPANDRPNMVRDLDRVLPERRLILGGKDCGGERTQEQ